MLASLLLSQGTPLLLAGDEFGHSQQGNNNAYAQDNEIGWLDWSHIDDDPEFLQQVKALIRLRHDQPLLRSLKYVHGEGNITWLTPDGQPMSHTDWDEARSFSLALGGIVFVLINGSKEGVSFSLPARMDEPQLLFSSSPDVEWRSGATSLPSLSIAVLGPK